MKKWLESKVNELKVAWPEVRVQWCWGINDGNEAEMGRDSCKFIYFHTQNLRQYLSNGPE